MQASPELSPDKLPSLISTREVCAQTSLSRSTLHVKVQAGEFPAPVTLGRGRKAFVQAEVTDWINQRIASRGGRAA